MRLRQMLDILNANLSDLSVVAEQVPRQDPPAFRIDNVVVLRPKLEALVGVPAFAQQAKELLSVQCMEFVGDIKPIVSQQELGKVKGAIDRLKRDATNLQSSLNASLPEQKDNVAVIQLGNVTDFRSLSSLLDDLGLLIDQTVALSKRRTGGAEDDSGAAVMLQNFDSGSFWLEVMLPGAGSLCFLGMCASYGFRFALALNRLKITVSEVRALGLAAQDIESAERLSKSMRNVIGRRLAEALSEDAKLDKNDAEAINIAQRIIERNAEMIQNGVRMFASSRAPEQVANAFPDKVKDLLAQGTTLLLGDGAGDAEDTKRQAKEEADGKHEANLRRVAAAWAHK